MIAATASVALAAVMCRAAGRRRWPWQSAAAVGSAAPVDHGYWVSVVAKTGALTPPSDYRVAAQSGGGRGIGIAKTTRPGSGARRWRRTTSSASLKRLHITWQDEAR